MSERAVVLGASGFIGTRLVRRLAGQGFTIQAVDIAPPREELPGVIYTRHDVRETLPPSLGAGASTLYNLAAIHRTPGHPAHEYYEANVKGALSATTLAEAAGIKTIVFTSSISVYGPCEDLLTEASQLRPVSDYGRSKQIAEAVHRQWAERDSRRRLVVARPGVVFGPGERGNYTHLAKALRRGLFFYPGRRDTIKGGGHVDELLGTFEFALQRAEPYVLYNFAYPDHSTTEEIVRTFGEVASFRDRCATVPTAALMAAAAVFEAANAVGIRNPIHRERITKLMISTRIAPQWLVDQGYAFHTNLKSALERWQEETHGEFV